MLRERGDVLAPGAERREAEADDGKPEVEVLAKAPVVHVLGEVAIRRSDDAHVDLPDRVAADAPDLAVLEDAEELRLQRRGKLADLVEEDGAALGLLEDAGAVRDRPAEGAPEVTEELTFDQVLGDAAAVDGDERPLRTARQVVDRPRDDLLPRPGLPFDEDDRLRGRRALDHPVEAAHLDAGADEPLERSLVRELDAHRLVAEVDPDRRAPRAEGRPRGDVRVAHADAVDERAVRAVRVDDVHRVASHFEDAVEARDGRILEPERAALPRPDVRGLPGEAQRGAAIRTGDDGELNRRKFEDSRDPGAEDVGGAVVQGHREKVYHVSLRAKEGPLPSDREAGQPRVGGRYVLGTQIGAGGMATVHVGRDTASGSEGRIVAIKRLLPTLAQEPEFAATLLDEGRIVSRIAHPNVVPLYEVIVEERDIFLVLEYVRGESLGALMRVLRGSGGRIPIDVACAIAQDVLRGLHAAHGAIDEHGRPLGVVHRDVSPQNVLVGVEGRTRLLDFGLAKAAGQGHSTRPGQIKGKLRYMAPEQVRGGLVTKKSDVYAVGVVLWEMLTLERPFGEPTDAEAMVEILTRSPAPPSSVAPEVPASLDRVVLRAMVIAPGERYATAEEMAIDLERTRGGASPARVAEWLQEVARPSLARRAALLNDEPPPRPPPVSEKGLAVVAAGIVLFLLALFVTLRFVGGR